MVLLTAANTGLPKPGVYVRKKDNNYILIQPVQMKISISLMLPLIFGFITVTNIPHQSANNLDLIKNKYYKELNTFNYNKYDSVFHLTNEISFNEPGKIDEEFSHNLFFEFKGPVSKGVNFNLINDSVTVKSRYDYLSVWNWGEEKADISGTITILEWDKKKIQIFMDIKVFLPEVEKTYQYLGKRNFNKTY